MVFDAIGPEIMDQFEQHMEEPPNREAKVFYDLLESAQRPLWDGCDTHSELSMAVKMLSIKVEGNISQQSFDEILQVMKESICLRITCLSLIFTEQRSWYLNLEWKVNK
jgi:hypothetical protein